ncbi:4157_t:CDS:2 [Cetraspora pellucida]|uniref:4157_t:CDS:1 n=1 Tax=Cetraspora pellucida TaxID=1433469 RepID=A0A9N9HNC8_9GLOM|nr:4157_t:CDS:2 [Cetraspora pellucida]
MSISEKQSHIAVILNELTNGSENNLVFNYNILDKNVINSNEENIKKLNFEDIDGEGYKKTEDINNWKE